PSSPARDAMAKVAFGPAPTTSGMRFPTGPVVKGLLCQAKAATRTTATADRASTFTSLPSARSAGWAQRPTPRCMSLDRLVRSAGLVAERRGAWVVRDADPCLRKLLGVWARVLEDVEARVLVGVHDVALDDDRVAAGEYIRRKQLLHPDHLALSVDLGLVARPGR